MAVETKQNMKLLNGYLKLATKLADEACTEHCRPLGSALQTLLAKFKETLGTYHSLVCQMFKLVNMNHIETLNLTKINNQLEIENRELKLHKRKYLEVIE